MPRLRAEERCAFRSAALSLLHQISTPVLIVDRRAQVVAANRFASDILARSSPILIHQGDECRVDPQVVELTAAIEEAFRNKHYSVVRVVRMPDASPVFIVTPASSGEDAFIVVFVLDLTIRPQIRADLLMAVYGLSAAEARIAAALARLRDRRAVAMATHLSVHTVRSHIRSMLSRTGARRESELIALFLSGVGTVAPGSEDSEIRLKGRCARDRKSLPLQAVHSHKRKGTR